MAGDWLIAEPTTIVGSIGVIMSTYNIKGLGEKIGLKDVTIKSGKNKDLLNPFAEVDPAQVAILQKMIDATYERFFGIVKDSRQIRETTLRELADGTNPNNPNSLFTVTGITTGTGGEQIAAFLGRQPNASHRREEQLLPTADHDGFFYCLLEKSD